MKKLKVINFWISNLEKHFPNFELKKFQDFWKKILRNWLKFLDFQKFKEFRIRKNVENYLKKKKKNPKFWKKKFVFQNLGVF